MTRNQTVTAVLLAGLVLSVALAGCTPCSDEPAPASLRLAQQRMAVPEDGRFHPFNMYSLDRSNADGTHTMMIYSKPINYWDQSSISWQPIDTTIVRLGDLWGVESGVYRAYFYADYMEVETEYATAKTYFLGTSDPSHSGEFELSVEENKAVYRDGITLEYVYTESGLKQNLVLSQPPRTEEDFFIARTRIEFDQPVYADQGEHFVTTEAVELRNSAGEVVCRLPTPIAFELNDYADQVSCEYEVAISGNEVLLSIRTPTSWLSEGRDYPVVVDPTYYSTTTLDGHVELQKKKTTYVADNTSTTFRVGKDELGVDNSVWRSFVSFDTSGISTSDTVTAATLGIKTS
ncbi:hypothetical protein ACFLVD_00995, partial [Chloroflexota bacterium]